MKTLSEPKYYKDILKQLRFVDAIPTSVLKMEDYLSGINQHMARAADEIEKLRKQNKNLKRKIKKQEESINQFVMLDDE